MWDLCGGVNSFPVWQWFFSCWDNKLIACESCCRPVLRSTLAYRYNSSHRNICFLERREERKLTQTARSCRGDISAYPHREFLKTISPPVLPLLSLPSCMFSHVSFHALKYIVHSYTWSDTIKYAFIKPFPLRVFQFMLHTQPTVSKCYVEVGELNVLTKFNK